MKTLTPVDFKAVAAKGCFVYCYLRKKDHTPYYVGLGTRAVRPMQPHSVLVPDEPWRIRVLRQGLSKDDAVNWECFYIQHFGRVNNKTGILRNLTDGGEGANGAVVSQQTRKKMSKARLGRKMSAQTRFRMSQSKKNLSAETRANYSRGNTRPCGEAKKQSIAKGLRKRHLEKLALLGFSEEEWAEKKRQEKAAKRKAARIARQEVHGKYQQSAEARENYRQAAIRREAAKKLACAMAA